MVVFWACSALSNDSTFFSWSQVILEAPSTLDLSIRPLHMDLDFVGGSLTWVINMGKCQNCIWYWLLDRFHSYFLRNYALCRCPIKIGWTWAPNMSPEDIDMLCRWGFRHISVCAIYDLCIVLFWECSALSNDSTFFSWSQVMVEAPWAWDLSILHLYMDLDFVGGCLKGGINYGEW